MAKPRQKTKSDETEAANPEAPVQPSSGDPALAAFTQGLEAIHRKDWAKAAELFDRAVAQSDTLDLTARARQFLAVARQKGNEAAGRPAPDEDRDPFLQAVLEKNRGNFAAALSACSEGGRDQKDERFAYLAASIHAAENRTDQAAQALSRAIELNPKNRIHAYHDADFAELRKNRDHRQIFGLS